VDIHTYVFIITYFKTYKYIKTVNPQVTQIFKKTTVMYIRTLCLILEHGTMTTMVWMHRTKEILYVRFYSNNKM